MTYINNKEVTYKYKPNEPIFLAELDIPKKSMFRSGSILSVDEVIRKKYLQDGINCCGYMGEILFANQLGLTTQVPALYEVYTNKATTEYRETRLANLRVILRKTYCEIDAEILQFLDLIKEVVDIKCRICMKILIFAE